VQLDQTSYRGYHITVFGMDRSWSFSAKPANMELPILRRSIFYSVAASGAGAVEVAKGEIDRLLDALTS
jgi:hypothetical protein